MQGYGHYKKIRFYVLGLLAWLMSYMLKTASNRPSAKPLLFFDFTGAALLGRRPSSFRGDDKQGFAR